MGRQQDSMKARMGAVTCTPLCAGQCLLCTHTEHGMPSADDQLDYSPLVLIHTLCLRAGCVYEKCQCYITFQLCSVCVHNLRRMPAVPWPLFIQSRGARAKTKCCTARSAVSLFQLPESCCHDAACLLPESAARGKEQKNREKKKKRHRQAPQARFPAEKLND
jgi:hypothetical protein